MNIVVFMTVACDVSLFLQFKAPLQYVHFIAVSFLPANRGTHTLHDFPSLEVVVLFASYMVDQQLEVTHYTIFHLEESMTTLSCLQNTCTSSDTGNDIRSRMSGILVQDWNSSK